MPELPAEFFQLVETVHANSLESALTREVLVSDIDERKAQRKRDKWKFILLVVLLGLLSAFFAVYTVQESDRSEAAIRDRDTIQATLNLVRDCVDVKRTDSDCQKQGNSRAGQFAGAIADANRDMLIVALQCFRDPINVDNAAIEDCILAEGEILRKERESQQ